MAKLAIKQKKQHWPRVQQTAQAACSNVNNICHINYLFTSNVQSLRENLRPRNCRIDRGLKFHVKTERSSLITCLLHGFLLGFCSPVIGPRALQENNALLLANQGALYRLQNASHNNKLKHHPDTKLYSKTKTSKAII